MGYLAQRRQRNRDLMSIKVRPKVTRLKWKGSLLTWMLRLMKVKSQCYASLGGSLCKSLWGNLEVRISHWIRTMAEFRTGMSKDVNSVTSPELNIWLRHAGGWEDRKGREILLNFRQNNKWIRTAYLQRLWKEAGRASAVSTAGGAWRDATQCLNWWFQANTLTWQWNL